MKMFFACIALVVLAAPAAQACTAQDFKVEDFKINVQRCSGVGCRARLKLAGKLQNNCGTPAAAHLEVVALDGSGNVVKSADGWPASTYNIDPGSAVDFDFGSLLSYKPSMKSFKVNIIEVKTW